MCLLKDDVIKAWNIFNMFGYLSVAYIYIYINVFKDFAK